jgi:tetratricopeptide (TPR) repeat protein
MRLIKLIFTGLLVATVLFSATMPAMALEGTSFSFTLTYDWYFVATQDAYLPAGTYLNDAGLLSPEDIYLHGRDLYIADTGNHRIVVFSLDSGELSSFGEDTLQTPTGIAVAEDGTIYVADYGKENVAVFTPQRTLRETIERPTQIYYGQSPYKPRKLALDNYGNIFVLSEGTHEGILQFNANYEFDGFFGANKTKDLSLIEWFQKHFYTDEQKSRMTLRNPPNIVSLDVDPEGMVLSVTQNDEENTVKKLNMAGVNIWEEDSFFGWDDATDIAVLKNGGFVLLESSGWITEYSAEHSMLVEFGGTASTNDRNGLTAVASAIETDEAGNLYVLDRERGVLQVWYPTDYAQILHSAEDLYNEGRYEESLADWTELLRMNPTSYMVNWGYAKALFQLGRYEEAAEHFKLVTQTEGYSDCLWRMRSAWFQRNSTTIILLFVALALVLFALGYLQKRYYWRDKLSDRYAAFTQRHRLIENLTTDVKYFLRHPIDGVYYIKTGERGGAAAAGIFYVVALIVQMVSRGLTPILFGGGYYIWNDETSILLITAVPIALFVVGSYLISSINNGEGTFRQVFTVFGYALTAFIIFIPLLTALSYALTISEVFIYRFLQFLIIGYTLVLFFIGIKEAQAYDLKQTIANALLTLFFVIVTILAAIVLFILWRELVDFVRSVLEEVSYRVFS